MIQTLHPRSQSEVDEMIAHMKEAARKIEEQPNGVQNFLLKHGFIDENGQLGERYRDKSEKVK